MESEAGLVSILKANLLPLALCAAGLIFIVVGLFSVLSHSNSPAQLQFQAGSSPNEASSSATIIVDIEGGVMNPGIYKLPEGSRTHDILVSAGGLSGSADRGWFQKNINQAAKLQDGQKIYIIRQGEDIGVAANSASSDASNSSVQINVNSASLTDLDSLPGIGPVTAQKIVDNRPYSSLEELVSKKAVSQSVFEKIKAKISL